MSPRRPGEIEDLEPVVSGGPALSASARISGGTGRWRAAVAVVAVFLVVAVLKPWGDTGTTGRTGRTSGDATAVEPGRQMVAAAPADDELADLRSNCDEPFGWRVYSREGPMRGMPFRVWSSVTPATSATGPTDPTIPLVQVGPTIEALGYCAPWEGADAPPQGVGVAAWELEPVDGSDGTVTARRLALDEVAPARPSQFTGLYHAHDPAGAGASHDPNETWPHGRYVFLVAADGWARWWAVEVSHPWGSPEPSASSRPVPASGAPAAASGAPASSRRPAASGGG